MFFVVVVVVVVVFFFFLLLFFEGAARVPVRVRARATLLFGGGVQGQARCGARCYNFRGSGTSNLRSGGTEALALLQHTEAPRYQVTVVAPGFWVFCADSGFLQRRRFFQQLFAMYSCFQRVGQKRALRNARVFYNSARALLLVLFLEGGEL